MDRVPMLIVFGDNWLWFQHTHSYSDTRCHWKGEKTEWIDNWRFEPWDPAGKEPPCGMGAPPNTAGDGTNSGPVRQYPHPRACRVYLLHPHPPPAENPTDRCGGVGRAGSWWEDLWHWGFGVWEGRAGGGGFSESSLWNLSRRSSGNSVLCCRTYLGCSCSQ
jgi:hypothetical protein